jgi:hypothetical protein
MKLVSRVDPELSEDAGEVALDRARRDEQHLCDLTVGEALSSELGDPALTRRQRIEPRKNNPARARAGRAQLGLGLFGKRLGACVVGGIECLAEELSRFGAPIAPPEQGAEVGEGACSLQPGVAPLELVDRLAEQGPSTITAGNNARSPLCHAHCARSAECPGELELLFYEASGRLALAERALRESGLRPPGEETRAGDHC